MKKLAIITTHPIQYYAPVFKLLRERGKVAILVFYTRGEQAQNKLDPGFGKVFSWDLPLLDGYPYKWVFNRAAAPGSAHYNGIINPTLIEEVSNWDPDAILVFGWAYRSHLKIIRYFSRRIPVYFRGDSTLLAGPGGIKGIIKYQFLKWVYKHIDFAFFVGQQNKAYFKRFGLKDRQLVFAPHAVDNGRFEADRSREAEQLRVSLKISGSDIVVLYAGKFETVKNVDLLLNAFLKLNDRKVHLLLVGSGIKGDLLKAMVVENEKSPNVHFMDFQNQTYMPVVYQAANLFCLPSWSETWGLSVNEAMACGCAVLVSDQVGCAVDLVRADVNGAVFKSGQADDLAFKLEKLTRSKELLRIYGENSKKIIDDWNFLVIANTIENTLNEKI